MPLDNEKLKSLLVLPGYISEADFKLAIISAEEKNVSLSEELIDRNLIKDEQLGQLIAEDKKYPFVNLREEKIDEGLLRTVPSLIAESQKVIAFGYDSDLRIKIGMVDPGNLETRNIIEKLFGRNTKIYLITERDFRQALLLYRATLKEEIEKVLQAIENAASETDKDSLMIRIVDLLLEYGYSSGASDIHIEPRRNEIIIRFRIDGVMYRLLSLSKSIFELILSRIKILAKIRTDEHSSAQDGKFQFQAQNEIIDARVSIVPVSEGENIVIRLLSVRARDVNLEDSGLSEKGLAAIKRIIKNPHGMILVTGPTGCGKTTTIYEMLKILNTSQVNIATIEDPVEYSIDGISQIQVNTKTDLTFAKGLRALVRQDPDIIMVGEIRDQETAGIAVNSAMTGHLVLSTLHANDAATTMPRLIDMGIEPYLVVSTIKVIIAQRLVRKICEKCRYSYKISEEEKAAISRDPELSRLITEKLRKNLDSVYLYKDSGCNICGNSGYRGRLGIFEVMEMTEKVKEKVIERAGSDDINKAAEDDGMITMLEDGLVKALNGDTTFEEILRVIGEFKV